MKKITLIAAICMFALTSNLNAQEATASATSETQATIVTPISIANDVALSFGKIAVTNTAGTVTLGADGTRTPSAGITLPTDNGTVTAAQFTVSGEGAYAYTVVLPETPITLTEEVAGTATMTVGEFTHNSTETLTGGSEAFAVGGILNIADGQAAGTYLNAADLEVTVYYN